eukprot:symbB.v1.2.008774.t1/scaffold549.1/size255684/15
MLAWILVYAFSIHVDGRRMKTRLRVWTFGCSRVNGEGDVLEPLLPMICGYCPVTGVLSVAAVSQFWCQAARSNQVWIQCSRSRWHFGALFQVGDVAPGARDEASLKLWQRSVEEYRPGVVNQHDAFVFFLKRCKQDKEAHQLLREAVDADETAAEKIFEQMQQLGANGLDILLKLEKGPDMKLRPLAKDVRLQITNQWAEQRWTQLLSEDRIKAVPWIHLVKVVGEVDVFWWNLMASREEVPVERKCSHNSSNSEVAPASAASTSVAPHVVHLIAAMRILNPEVLRVTYVYQAFRNCAESFRPRARKLYHYSRKSDKIATFWSHSWHGSRWQKISTLFLLYNGWASVVFGTLAALLMSTLFACGILPGFSRLAIFPEIPFSIWGLTTGILVTLLLFCFGRPKQEVFFDRICIHPGDEALKLDAIFSLAGILKESKEMLVLWDQSWSSRLWCLFELAAFLKSTVDSDSKGGARILTVRPTWVGSCSIVAFLTLWINTLAFTTLPVSGSGGTDILISLVGCMVLASVLGLSIVVAFRSYFRSVALLEQKLQRTSFDTVRSMCCQCGHLDASGNTLVCDREALKQCVALWFGSLEAFEEYIRSKVCNAVVHDLRSKVFTKMWTLQVSTPVLWGFMDLVATFIRIG